MKKGIVILLGHNNHKSEGETMIKNKDLLAI